LFCGVWCFDRLYPWGVEVILFLPELPGVTKLFFFTTVLEYFFLVSWQTWQF